MAKEFPQGFIWGTSASSYQTEGAHLTDGRGPCTWDTFSQIPGKIENGDTGNIAADHHHRYKEDIALLAKMGIKHYNLSVSWSRVQPLGRGKVNPKGIQFYSDLIDELIKHGITPWIHLYHWDIPTALQLETDGFLNPDIADYFGLNHYSTSLAENADLNKEYKINVYDNGGLYEDEKVILHADPRWKKTEMGWNVVPWGLQKLLNRVGKRYHHPEIFITENGVATDDKIVNGTVNDQDKIDYLNGYIAEAHKTIQDGVNLKGYFVWSFIDNFEWALGYSKRFGLHHVDFKTGKRIPKKSAYWFKKVIKNNRI